MRVGRNELCPCGSGQKFKNCHEGKGRSKDLYVLAAIAAVVVIGVILFLLRNRGDQATSRVTASTPAAAPATQPVTTQPVTGQPVTAQPATGQPAVGQQPVAATPMTGMPSAAPQAQPGPAPAGKVWSAEHGHWHDVPPGTTLPPPTAANPIQITKRPPQGPPPGPAPPGKVWSAEHGHWHDAPKQ